MLYLPVRDCVPVVQHPVTATSNQWQKRKPRGTPVTRREPKARKSDELARCQPIARHASRQASSLAPRRNPKRPHTGGRHACARASRTLGRAVVGRTFGPSARLIFGRRARAVISGGGDRLSDLGAAATAEVFEPANFWLTHLSQPSSIPVSGGRGDAGQPTERIQGGSAAQKREGGSSL